jgi:iron-sulfur cluster assembly accessory protein
VSTSSNPPKENKSPAANELKLSDTCIKRLREICNDGSFLRVTVEGGGCSGFQYKLEIDSNLEKDDLQFGPKDAKVVIGELFLYVV